MTLTSWSCLLRLSLLLRLPPLCYCNVYSRRGALTVWHHIDAELMYISQRKNGLCEEGTGNLPKKYVLHVWSFVGDFGIVIRQACSSSVIHQNNKISTSSIAV